MVLQKNLDYGFNGYRVPAIPRATRSARKRCTFKKRGEAKQMCAFDLLATVAGKLLLDKEDIPSSSNMSKNNVKEENQEEDCNKKFFLSGIVLENHDQGVVTSSDSSERFGSRNMVNGKTENKMESLPCKVEVDPAINTRNGENKRLVNFELEKTNDSTSHLDDPVVWNEKPPMLASSDSSTKAPSYGDQNLHSSFPVKRGDVNLVSKDDDENSSGCTHPSTIKRSFGSMPRIGDRRMRKILASRCWKVAPKLKDARHSNTESEEDLKPSYWEKNNSYKRLRSERNYPFKKRKFFHYTSLSNSEEGISSEGIAHSPEKHIDEDATGSCQKMNGATGESFSVADQPGSRDSLVKLRIKSFRVPELFIEIPETATVDSLKRTVMEAVTAILGDGLRVGVLIQGKKVRDDNKTLLQTGISHDNNSDVLGFSLEPNPKQTPLSFCTGDSQPLTSFIESDHDSAPSPTGMSNEKSTTESKALIAVPAPMSVEALSVVPSYRKSKRSEAVQRRIRRPFSVSEVEALVQAVEKLGTGRWRDVKLCAFDNAKHRTYVDLKDKWKTLVHTARISPQQRRGEPVPQELLDRVLTAHAYWSQQLKMQPETCLLL